MNKLIKLYLYNLFTICSTVAFKLQLITVSVPVCPHAGGVGLCEFVQHISIFDYIAVSGSLENR